MSRNCTDIGQPDAESDRTGRSCIFHFRGAVQFDEDAIRELCRLARDGYEASFKKETYGFLFGRLDRKRRLTIHRSCFYRGGTRTRTGVTFKDWATVARLVRRRRELSRRMRLRFAGSFHSHVEIAGTVFRGLSESDRESFEEDPMSTIEVVVFVWKGTGRRMPRSPRDIVAFEPATGYHYRIRCHAKRDGNVRQVMLRVISSGVIVVY
ncbi:hypothetical protein JXD38_06695 [candidate division WOR-3 bacterium]|nr:hypothetical protein [candidate division WOR-3 bacterium]